MNWMLHKVKVWKDRVKFFLRGLEKEKDYVLLHVDKDANPTKPDIILQTKLTKGEANFTNLILEDHLTETRYLRLKDYKKIFKVKKN